MTFTSEYITEGSDVENTPEHKKAFEMGGGLLIGTRVVDHERGAVFYCLSVGGGPEGVIPGRYLLFYKGRVIEIKALRDARWVEGTGNVTTYTVNPLRIEDMTGAERAEILPVLEAAFDAVGKGYSVKPAAVKVKFR